MLASAVSGTYNPPLMANFLGGSAYAMATGIADGYHLVSERTFRTMNRPDLELFTLELDRHLREVRAEQVVLNDLEAVKHKNRKIQRLSTALMILRAYRQKYRA